MLLLAEVTAYLPAEHAGLVHWKIIVYLNIIVRVIDIVATIIKHKILLKLLFETLVISFISGKWYFMNKWTNNFINS